jgi:hypothetical protein
MACENRRLWTALLALLVAFTVAASPLAPAALLLANQPPELVSRLRDEKLVVAGPQPRSDGGSSFVGYVVFDRPVERVFELLRETSRQVEFRPDLDRVESVERNADGSLDEHHASFVFTDLVYRLRYRFEPGDRRISWRLDPGFENALRRVEGRWELEPVGAAQTLARFETSIEVGPALPRFLEDAVASRTVPTTLERCRRWVNADGVWR